MKIWIMVMVVYGGPYDSENWDGPWDFATARAAEKAFKTEADCRNSAIQLIAHMHEGMLAPMRFECVPFAANLPKGTPR